MALLVPTDSFFTLRSSERFDGVNRYRESPSYMRKKGWPSRWKNKPNGLVVEGCLDNWDKIDVPLYKRNSFVLTLENEKKCRSSY